MSGKIVQFPLGRVAGAGASGDEGPRSCDRCVHFLSGVSGDYCRTLGVDLMSLDEAEECDLFNG